MILPWSLLLLVYSTVVEGVHPCLESDSGRCTFGTTDVDVRYCGLGDEDFEDLSRCLDTAGRSTITEVNLDDNDLVDFPEGLFAGLSAVTYIRINHLPYLTEVPEGLFENLATLEKISLRNNALVTLPEGLFSGLSLLRTIHMDHNPIAQLPAGLFSGLSSLELLRMRDLHLAEVEEDLFSGLSALRELYFYENQVDLSEPSVLALPPTLFRDTQNLEELWIHTNNIVELDPEIFSGLTKLSFLHLDLNPIKVLEDGLFSGLSSLETLRLRGLDVSEVPEGTFNGLSALKNLYLYETESDIGLPPALFQDNKNLEILWLNKNSCGDVDENLFSGLSKLQFLRLTFNSLSSLPEDVFTDLGQLQELYLGYNKLTTLPAGIFSNQGQLQYLGLSDNLLETLPGGLFTGLTSIVEIGFTTVAFCPTLSFFGFSPAGEILMDSSASQDESCEGTETCSNGLEGIDGSGGVCCPLGCGQCGGKGCSKSGSANGLGGDSCCSGGIMASDEYCDETNEAPCIIGSRPGEKMQSWIQ
ncbi:unnamed protein product [Ectocarpus sp. 12 AP-2014]